MEQGFALEISRQGIQVALIVILPLLAVSLAVGLLVSIFQAVTSVQETTLTFVPKMLAIALVLTFLGNWMMVQLIGFTHVCFERIATVGRY
jgi:flagellar biosynthetic protein FliQ